jgi:hypothetical protein
MAMKPGQQSGAAFPEKYITTIKLKPTRKQKTVRLIVGLGLLAAGTLVVSSMFSNKKVKA